MLERRFSAHPLVIAHRGYRALFPENTLLAFDRSVGRADMIELDVRLSADGEVVVFHDALLSRTTDAMKRGPALGLQSLRLSDWSIAQLRQLDAGSWFLESDPFGSLAAKTVQARDLRPHLPQPIPTLDQVLTWCRTHNMPLNIELKHLGDDDETRGLAEKVVAAIRRQGLEEMILISSFNHSLLHLCRLLAPKIARAALQDRMHPPGLLAYLQALQVCAYHPEDAITDQALVGALRAVGIAVNVFTVNDPGRQMQLARFGVSGLITDYPQLPACQQG